MSERGSLSVCTSTTGVRARRPWQWGSAGVNSFVICCTLPLSQDVVGLLTPTCSQPTSSAAVHLSSYLLYTPPVNTADNVYDVHCDRSHGAGAGATHGTRTVRANALTFVGEIGRDVGMGFAREG